MEYDVTGLEKNYGHVELPLTSVNFIQFIKLPELRDRVAEIVQICANTGRMAPMLAAIHVSNPLALTARGSNTITRNRNK